eukprot:545283-Rhodomonas_salina.1
MGKNVLSCLGRCWDLNANKFVPKCKWNDNWVKLFYHASLGVQNTVVGLCCCPSISEAVRIGAGWGYSWVHIRMSTETRLYQILPNNPGTNVFYMGGGCLRFSGITGYMYPGTRAPGYPGTRLPAWTSGQRVIEKIEATPYPGYPRVPGYPGTW